jgi:hypothetical protein
VRDDGFCFVVEILCRAARVVFRLCVVVDKIDIGKIDVELLESVRRNPRCSAAMNRLATLGRLFDTGRIFSFWACGLATFPGFRNEFLIKPYRNGSKVFGVVAPGR